MILNTCKFLLKVSLFISICSPLTTSKSIEKRQSYQEYPQQPYYPSGIENQQEYLPQHEQQYEAISEDEYQQAQIEHINQQLKHKLIGPQTQTYYNQGRRPHYQQQNQNHGLNGPQTQTYNNQQREQHYQQQNQNRDQLNYGLNERYINQHQSQPQQINSGDYYLNGDQNYKQNRRHIDEENVQQQLPIEQTENKEENKEEKIEQDENNEKHEQTNKKEDHDSTSEESKSENDSGVPKEETKTEKPTNEEEKAEDLTNNDEVILKKELDDENKISSELLKETNKAEDCESKEYLQAKHETGKNEVIEENVDDAQTISTNENVEVTTPGDKTRNERTIVGRLHEIDDPRVLIDNFRHKLKSARSNIEQMEIANKRKADPRIFVYNPNLPQIPSTNPTRFQSFAAPTHHTVEDYHFDDDLPYYKNRQSVFEGLKGKSVAAEITDPQKVITSPVIDDSISDSSEEKKTEDNKTTGPLNAENEAEGIMEPKDRTTSIQEQSPRSLNHGRNTPPEEIRQLLHVRDEINRIRHIMQVLKEHDLKQKYGPQFQNSRNLTETEQRELKDFVEKLKKDGKISTTPLQKQIAAGTDEDGAIQNNPAEVPNTRQLIEDIGKLKESIKHFAKNVGVHKDDSTEANLEKLEEQIIEQKQEIENLQKLVEDLLPPTDFPSASSSTIIKNPDLEKHHLHHELQTLQEMLTDLLNKEETTLKTAKNVAGKLRARASDDETKNNPKETSEKEIGTLVKILQTVQHPANDKNSVLIKLEQIEHDIKKLDIQNHRTRQELLLEKLEREVKNLKNIKSSTGDNNEDISEKIKKLEDEIDKQHNKNHPTTINAKLEELQKQIQQLSKPMGRELDDGNMEKELEKLQKQIESMSNKDNAKPASRQLEGLLSDILSNSVDNSNEKQATNSGNLPSQPILNAQGSQQAPVFQIPYCLQKHPNYAIYHQDASNLNVQPGHLQTLNYQQPIKQQQINYGPPPISYNNYKYYPQPQQVIIQPAAQQQYQPQKQQIYLPPKPVTQLYQHPKPIVHQVYGQVRPQQPVYAPAKIYSPPKPDVQQVYESVKPIIQDKYKPVHVETNQGYSSSNYNEEDQYKTIPTDQAQKSCGHTEAMEEEIKKLNGMLNILNEKIEYGADPEPEEYAAVYRSKNSKSKTRTKRESENIEREKQQLIHEIQARLVNLRKEMQTVDEPQLYDNTSNEQNGRRSAYYQAEGSFHQPFGSKLSLKKKQKFDDLFIKVVKFILHKLEISAPYVVESLFNGETYDQEYDGYNNNGYRSSQQLRSNDDDDFDSYVEDNNENEVQNKKQNLFGGLLNNFQGFPGLLGFIPNILLKLLSNFSSLLNFLKRNKFFKNFLFPGALILVIDGIMALLVWWFSADDTQNLFDFNINQALPNVENNRYV